MFFPSLPPFPFLLPRVSCVHEQEADTVTSNLLRQQRSHPSEPGDVSEYENVVVGKLKLKGKALDVKSGGIKKKKKKHQQTVTSHNEPSGVEAGVSTEHLKDINEEHQLGNEENHPAYDDHLTPAERKYIEQRAKLDTKLLVKTSNKSHRDKIQDFNQYLANLSEHYDIPKVGPG